MLQAMRHLTQSMIFKGLMLLLLFSFTFWGIGDIFRGNPMQRTVAKVGSDSISVQTLEMTFKRSLAYARSMFGQGITEEQARKLGMMNTALQSLINRSLMEQAAVKMGINVNAKTAYAQLASQPSFRDENGKFNRELFQSFLEKNNLTEQDVTSQLARGQLTGVFTVAPEASKMATTALYLAMGQKRVVDIITLKNKGVGDIIPKDESVVREYYTQNPAPFTSPEHRNISIAQLSTDAYAKDIVISDDQVAAEYTKRGDQLMQPEKRDLLQVIVQDEAKAKSLAEAAKKSGHLAEAAKTAGYDTVPLKAMDKDALLTELAAPIFALSKDGISDPIKTKMGWHIMQVAKIIPPNKPTLAEIKDDLRATMRRDQAVESITKTVNSLDDELAAGHALEDIADELRLRLVKIPAVEANGKTPDNKVIAELPSNKDEVLKIAFEQNAGETSPVIDDKKGNYIVVRTDDVTTSAVKPFESVKAQATTLWMQAEQAKQARAEADKIAEALRSGATVASFVTRKNVDIHTSKPISLLGDSDDELPVSAMPQVMKLAKKDAAVITEADQQIIIHLSKVIDADANPTAETLYKVADEFNSHKGNELQEQFAKFLGVLFPVRINQEVMESVIGQGG